MQVTGSKNIAALYFSEAEGTGAGTLTTVFKNGRKYKYQNVPCDVYLALAQENECTAEDASVGKVFNKLVRSGGFEFEEITE